MLSFEGEGGQGGGEDDDDTTEHLVDGGVGVDQTHVHERGPHDIAGSGNGKEEVTPALDPGRLGLGVLDSFRGILGTHGNVALPSPLPRDDALHNEIGDEAGCLARKGEEGLVERLLEVNTGFVGSHGARLADIGSLFTEK